MATLKKKKKKNDSLTIVTPVGRVSFPHLLKARAGMDNGVAKYQLDLLFPKSAYKAGGELDKGFASVPQAGGNGPWRGAKVELTDMKEAVLETAKKFFHENTLTLSDFAHPFKDGDTKTLDSFKGMYVITPKSGETYKPKVYNAAMEEMSDEQIAKIKGGDYARLVLRVYAYDTKGNSGVTFGLQAVQFVKAGPSFGGGNEVVVKMLGEVDVEIEELEDTEEEESESSDVPEDTEEDELEEVAPKALKQKTKAAKLPVKAAKSKKPAQMDDEESEEEGSFDVEGFEL